MLVGASLTDCWVLVPLRESEPASTAGEWSAPQVQWMKTLGGETWRGESCVLSLSEQSPFTITSKLPSRQGMLKIVSVVVILVVRDGRSLITREKCRKTKRDENNNFRSHVLCFKRLSPSNKKFDLEVGTRKTLWSPMAPCIALQSKHFSKKGRGAVRP